MIEIEDILKEIESKEGTMLRVVVLFNSLISGKLIYRVAYFTDIEEANRWKQDQEAFYGSHGMRFCTYLDSIER